MLRLTLVAEPTCRHLLDQSFFQDISSWEGDWFYVRVACGLGRVRGASFVVGVLCSPTCSPSPRLSDGHSESWVVD